MASDDWWVAYPGFPTKLCGAQFQWLLDIAAAAERSGLAGLLQTRFSVRDAHALGPPNVMGELYGMKFAFSSPRWSSDGGKLVTGVLCLGRAVLQVAVPAPWETGLEMRLLANPHYLLPWCFEQIDCASQIYTNWTSPPSELQPGIWFPQSEFLRPTVDAVTSATEAIGTQPMGKSAVVTCMVLPKRP